MKESWSQERLLEAARKALVLELPVEIVNISKNCRDHTEAAIDTIARSMEQIGQVSPGTTTTTLDVFEGVGRVLALRKLGRPTFRTTIIESTMSRTEWRVAQISTSIHVEKLSDDQLYQNVMTLLGERTDWKQVDLAKHLAVDQPTICRWLSPSKTTEKSREALKDGRIGFTETMRLARIPYDEQDSVLESILAGTIRNRDELDRAVRERKKLAAKPSGRKAGPTRVTAVVSGVTLTAAGKSLDVAGLIDVLVKLLSHARSAKKERLSLGTFEAKLRDQGNGGEEGVVAA